MEDWKIGPPGEKCAACAKALAPGDAIVSAVAEAAGALERRDFCAGCGAPAPGTVLSFWRTSIPRPPAGPPKADPAEVSEFFARLLANPERGEQGAKLLYLVTLWLLRKRRLKLLERKPGALRVERTWDGEVAVVPEAAVAESEIEPLVAELEKLFR